jgi:hypothetical protein
MGDFNINARQVSANCSTSEDPDVSNINVEYSEYGRLIDHLNHALKIGNYRLYDVFREKYKAHPVTFGDGPLPGQKGLEDSVHDYPPYYDTTLTPKSLIGSRQCIDYMFYGEPIQDDDDSVEYHPKWKIDWEGTQVEHFHVHGDPKISQLSDHYGLMMTIRPTPK